MIQAKLEAELQNDFFSRCLAHPKESANFSSLTAVMGCRNKALVSGGNSFFVSSFYIESLFLILSKIQAMEKWVCVPCGYVYDPEIGDPDGGIAPGTSFQDIPDDWVCPVCGMDKSSFELE